MTKLFIWVLARLARLPPARARRIDIQRGIRIPMPDGVTLAAERYCPAISGGDRLPVLVSRTPYGLKLEGIVARLMAQRGYQVLVVSCRGTFDSLGEWEPLFNEAADGTAVLKWVADQAWFPGKLGTFGDSYRGFTQWAVLGEPPTFVSVASVMQSQSRFVDIIWPKGTFALANNLFWAGGVEYQELPLLKFFARLRIIRRKLGRAADTLPVAHCDTALIGHSVGVFQEWLANADRSAAYWERIHFGSDVARVPPTLLVAGWHDLFCAGQLGDFVRLRQADRPVRLVVGPWRHGQVGGALVWLRETLAWFDAQFHQRPIDAHSVRLFDLGTRRWRDFPDWPPPATRTRWYFQGERRLASTPAQLPAADRYRFDPAAPTPAVGGNYLDAEKAGPRDNRATEARADVLTYTSKALEKDTAVIGTIHADLYARSSLDYTDFFVRLCDVHPDGRSINLCDGIVRLSPENIARAADGTFMAHVELTPTANTFRRGHRIRVQVTSGAHPLYSRNPGTGEPIGTATRLLPANQEILHGPDHPSAIELPVVA